MAILDYFNLVYRTEKSIITASYLIKSNACFGNMLRQCYETTFKSLKQYGSHSSFVFHKTTKRKEQDQSFEKQKKHKGTKAAGFQ